MRITVEKDGRQSTVTATAGVLGVEGSLTDQESAEVRRALQGAENDPGGSAYVYWDMQTPEDARREVPQASDEWIALVCLLQFPAMGYRVGIVAEADAGRG